MTISAVYNNYNSSSIPDSTALVGSVLQAAPVRRTERRMLKKPSRAAGWIEFWRPVVSKQATNPTPGYCMYDQEHLERNSTTKSTDIFLSNQQQHQYSKLATVNHESNSAEPLASLSMKCTFTRPNQHYPTNT